MRAIDVSINYTAKPLIPFLKTKEKHIIKIICISMKYFVINLIYIIFCQKKITAKVTDIHNDFNFSHETDDTLICAITDSFV